ncbi:MAG: MBL fold metallo-hydrolase [Nitrospiraceae bacterium]
MMRVLAEKGLRLRAICLTHGHSDHAEGIEDLLHNAGAGLSWPWRPRSARLAPSGGAAFYSSG